MKNNNDNLISVLYEQKLYEGRNTISIIFHDGKWKDIFISNYNKKNNDNPIAINKSDFINILKIYKNFPEFGQIDFKILIKDKKIMKFKSKITNRIHNI